VVARGRGQGGTCGARKQGDSARSLDQARHWPPEEGRIDANWSLKLVTGPAEEPITATEAKLHCRIDTSTDDALIAAQITAARQWAENYTNRGFITQTWRVKFAEFPASADYFEIPRAPLASVTSIAYVDEAGDTQTWASGNYVVSADAEPGRISLAYSKDWPGLRDQADAVTITYVVGYGAAATVPEAIKAAIKLQVGDLYQNREAAIIGVSHAVNPSARALLDPYRVVVV
jgi:uncharacterized phiE125 gp8 family phage protein